MSQVIVGVDGPVGWTDHYGVRGVRGHVSVYKPGAIVATDLSSPKFYKLLVRNGRGRPIVATGSFASVFQLYLELGLGEKLVDGSFPKKCDFASINPVILGREGDGRVRLAGDSNLFASRRGEHRKNLLAADLAITAPLEHVVEAWDALNRVGWKADLQVA
jgi:hypothetical protein